MYEAAGILSSEDGAVSVLAGATLGGEPSHAGARLCLPRGLLLLLLLLGSSTALRALPRAPTHPHAGGTRVNWCASFHTPQHVRCGAPLAGVACGQGPGQRPALHEC